MSLIFHIVDSVSKKRKNEYLSATATTKATREIIQINELDEKEILYIGNRIIQVMLCIGVVVVVVVHRHNLQLLLLSSEDNK